MMSRRLTNQLLDQTVQAARIAAVDQTVVLRYGTVTAVDPTRKTLSCEVGGTVIRGVPHMASYTPAVNDVVWLLHQNSQLVAIGKR
jgi:hypothetical protein